MTIDPFDSNLHGVTAGEQLADISMRLRGLEEAVLVVVDAVHDLNPDLLESARTAARLQYQQRRDRQHMQRPDDQALLLRFLAQKLHVLETPSERAQQRPPRPA